MASDKSILEKAGSKQAPAGHGEAMQRHINRTSKHSERVRHGGGKPGAKDH